MTVYELFNYIGTYPEYSRIKDYINNSRKLKNYPQIDFENLGPVNELKVPKNYLPTKLEVILRKNNSNDITFDTIYELLFNDEFDKIIRKGISVPESGIKSILRVFDNNINETVDVVLEIIDNEELTKNEKIDRLTEIFEFAMKEIHRVIEITNASIPFKTVVCTLLVLDMLHEIIIRTKTNNWDSIDLNSNITKIGHSDGFFELKLGKIISYLLETLERMSLINVEKNIHTYLYNIKNLYLSEDKEQNILDLLYETGLISDIDETHELKYRDEEIELIKTIGNKKWINNIILVGEPGVGKTDLIKYINMDESNNFKIVNFKIDQMTIKMIIPMVTDMFRQMMKNDNEILEMFNIEKDKVDKLSTDIILEYLIRYVEKKNNIRLILFIDEIHKYLKEKTISDYLKPILTREHIKVIGATTYKEYDSYIAKDVALTRRFESLYINPLNEEQTIDVIKTIIKPILEEKHNVTIPDELVDVLVKLTSKYYRLSKFKNPALSINVLDTVSSYCNNSGKNTVTETDIKYILSKLTNITMESMYVDSDKIVIFEKIKEIENIIRSRVKGQEEAVNTVLKSIKKYLLGLHDKNKPIGVFLFLGPTGVGKTELAKAVAQAMFGSEDNIIRLDMSEFKRSHSIEKLWGSPPGYVGYNEGGILSNEIRKKPNSVILLDEIEKASRDVQDAFLHIFDDARMRDGRGNEYDFSNTIIIMTSNLFSDTISNSKTSYSKIKKYIKTNITKVMRPEFVNRIDNILIFEKLDNETAKEIAISKLNELIKIFNTKGYNLIMNINDVANYIVKYKYNPSMGGRSINRYVFNTLQGAITDKIVDKMITNGDVVINVYDKKLKIEV